MVDFDAAGANSTRSIWSDRAILIPAAILTILALAAIFAPYLGAIDPTQFDPASRNKLPGARGVMRLANGDEISMVFLLGTDSLGRDIYSRLMYGARISLAVGALAACVATVFGLMIGVIAGYIRVLDGLIMRFMDGMMAIPSILLAIALLSLSRAGLAIVILAIAIPEIPRVARLARSVVLSIREEPYVEAAIAAGAPVPAIIFRHILPNCLAPTIVQATFICASAILVESILSFLGVGLPPEIPSWGNVMASGRQYFRLFPHNIFFPGLLTTITILCVNLLGDALRDRLDPKLRRRI